jgi:hypothetical protein
VQAKVYYESGAKGCWQWIENVEKALNTQSAKELLEIIKNDENFTSCWWDGLMKVESRDDSE